MALNKRPQIGIQDIVYAVLTESSDVSGGTPTYGTVQALAGGMKFEAKHNGQISTLFADDGPAFSANSVGKIQVSVDLYDVLPAAYSEITGASRANGITQDTPIDQSPYIALGYKTLLAGAESGSLVYKYRWLLKGKFARADEGGETKKDTLNYKQMTLQAEFVKLNANNVYKTEVRTDDTDVAAGTISGWFSQPVYSNSASLTSVTVGTITGNDTANTITIPFAKSGETFSVVAPTDNRQITVSVVSTGLLLAGTSTYAASASGTAPTITITNSNIGAVEYLVTVTGNVVDSNGVHVTALSQLVTPA